MKKYLLFCFTLMLMSAGASAQHTKYWVYLTDKNNTPYTVSSPSSFLSSKAIQRRSAQNIPIKTDDLPVDPAYISGIRATGVTVLYTSKWLNAVAIYTTDASKVNQVNALPYVASVKPVQRLSSGKRLQPKLKIPVSAETILKSSSAAYNYGPSYRQINMLGGDQLHNSGYKGEGMVIAVLDAGFGNVHILPAFDSLRAQNRILGTRDFVTNDNDVYADHSHGMHVLSTMAAILPGELVGTAPHASYWLIRTEDAATESIIEESNWVRGAEFADSVGADIINSSLGYTTFDDPSMNHTYADLDGNTTIITRAADIAASKGILVVNSAGNEGNSSWRFISAPADGDSVLTIGAVDTNENIAAFSSRGPASDGRIKPNVCAMGQAAIVAGVSGGAFAGNGTSFSSPIMAGMAACLWQSNKTKTNMQVFDAIQRSADRHNNPDTIYGYGIPNFSLAALFLTGTENIERAESSYLKVYPNPFSESLRYTLFSKDGKKITLDLTDINGRIIRSEVLEPAANSYVRGEFTLHSDISAGMYLIRMKTDTELTITKLVKE